MATPEETKLVLQIEANIKSLERSLKQAGLLEKQLNTEIQKDFTKTGGVVEQQSQRIDKSMRQTQAATQNLTFQLNDITQGLLSGTSPFTIMVQQSSQVAQAVGSLGKGNLFKGIGGAFLSFLSPANLAISALILGFGYLTQAASDYFSSSDKAASESEKAWKQYADAVAAMKGAYGEATAGLADYEKKSGEVAKFELERARTRLSTLTSELQKTTLRIGGDLIEFDPAQAKAARQKFREAIQAASDAGDEEAVKRLREEMSQLNDASNAAAAGIIKVAAGFEGIEEEIRAFAASAADGTADFVALDQALALKGLTTTDEKLLKTIDRLREFIAEGVKMQKAVEAIDAATVDFSKTADTLATVVFPNLTKMFDAIISGNQQLISQFGQSLPQAMQSFAEATGAALTQLVNLQKASATINQINFQPYGQLTPVTSGAGVFFPSQTQLAQAEEQRKKAEQEAEEAQRAVERATEKSKREAERAAEQASEKLANAIANQVSVAVDAASALIGKSETANRGEINSFLKAGGVDLDAATTAWCAAFVNSALAQVGVTGSGSNVANSFLNWGNKIDPSQVQRGDVLVKNRGRGAGEEGGHVGFATGQMRFMEGMQQLEILSGNASNKVTTDWVNASDIIARRAAEGFAVPKDALRGIEEQSKKTLDQQKKLEQQYAQFASIASGAVSGFVNDLRNGVSAAEALRNALNRVIDGIIDMAIQSMFAKDALGGVFGKIFSFGTKHRGTGDVVTDMRNASPAIFAGAPRLHNGLMPGEYPAILQKGEAVIPRSVVRRGGMGNGGNTYLGDVAIDVQTGMVTASNEDARDLGQRINTAVQAVLVAESRPGGLLRQRGA